MGIGATAGVGAVGGIALTAQASGDTSTSKSSSSDALVFDKDAYSTLTTTITDADGADHEVEYRFHKAITYVTKPVDEAYQSLNVSVPVKIDGTAVDATNAPILFANAVGGYMPSSVADATGVGGGGTTGMPGGGAGGGVPSGSASPSASAADGSGEVASGGNGSVSCQAGLDLVPRGAPRRLSCGRGQPGRPLRGGMTEPITAERPAVTTRLPTMTIPTPTMNRPLASSDQS